MAASTNRDKKWVLCVGWTCVDIVSVLETFPKEDTDCGFSEYYWQRGGNASNTATVLSELGRPCELLTAIAKNCPEYQFLMEDLAKHNINIDHCVLTEGSQCPLATVMLCKDTGSRTILYTLKDLPELREENLAYILQNIHQYSWIHFEGRPNVGCISNILEQINTLPDRGNLVTSVELEHSTIKHLEGLVNKADYIFISKDYAVGQGLKDKLSTVQHFSGKTRPGATVVCTWGEQGAAAKQNQCETVSVPAVKIDKIVDTLGAGDTFIAAFIDSALQRQTLIQSLVSACDIAAKKCTIKGYSGLAKFKSK